MEALHLVLVLMTGIALISGVVYGAYQWFVAASLMLSIGAYFRPEINPWGWRTLLGPASGLFVTRWLTAEGKEHAQRFWIAIRTFFLCVAVPFAMAYLTELITGTQIIRR